MESQSSERGAAGATPGGTGSSGAGRPLVRAARDLWYACAGGRTARAGDPAGALGLPRIGRRVTSKAHPPIAAALADRYTVERELGRGGMATVYLAEEKKSWPQSRDQGAAARDHGSAGHRALPA